VLRHTDTVTTALLGGRCVSVCLRACLDSTVRHRRCVSVRFGVAVAVWPYPAPEEHAARPAHRATAHPPPRASAVPRACGAVGLAVRCGPRWWPGGGAARMLAFRWSARWCRAGR